MIISGNVQVDDHHLSLGADLTIPSRGAPLEVRKKYESLANAMKGVAKDGGAYKSKEVRPLALLQLNHTGRQSPNILGGRWPFVRPLSCSSTKVSVYKTRSQIALSSSDMVKDFLTRAFNLLMFQRARSMTKVEIEGVVDAFVRASVLGANSGFDGVELHAAHGCTLSLIYSRTHKSLSLLRPSVAVYLEKGL